MAKRSSTWLVILIALLAISIGYLLSERDAEPRTVAVDFRPIAELATVEYTGVAEIANERVPDDIRRQLGVREEVLMLVYGTVKAGFDLAQLPDDAIWTDRGRVQVVLPPPVILSTSIDTDRTRVVTHARSFLLEPDPTIVDEAIDLGAATIREEALDAGLLERARIQGKNLVEGYLRQLGFNEVRVIVR
jgi:hypothetical protein